MEQTLHLFVTEKCPNNCKLCCNKNYPVEEIPVVTVEDIKSSNIVCITGGDPFEPPFGRDVMRFIKLLRSQYTNIEKLYVYSSGVYFGDEIKHNAWTAVMCPRLLGNSGIDGISWGPKTKQDWEGLISFAHEYALLKNGREPECDNIVPIENRLYVFPESEKIYEQILFAVPRFAEILHASVIHRKWQKTFVPAKNSIFRRLPVLYQF